MRQSVYPAVNLAMKIPPPPGSGSFPWQNKGALGNYIESHAPLVLVIIRHRRADRRGLGGGALATLSWGCHLLVMTEPKGRPINSAGVASAYMLAHECVLIIRHPSIIKSALGKDELGWLIWVVNEALVSKGLRLCVLWLIRRYVLITWMDGRWRPSFDLELWLFYTESVTVSVNVLSSLSRDDDDDDVSLPPLRLMLRSSRLLRPWPSTPPAR